MPAKKTTAKPKAAPTIELPAIEPEPVAAPADPVEFVGEFQVTKGPLVIADLQTLTERWPGRPDHPACIYVEGPPAELARIKKSLNRFDIEELADGNWRIVQENRLVADHNLGAIRRFLTQQDTQGCKAFILGSKTGAAIAIHEARGGVGVHNEPRFNICGIKVDPNANVKVEKQGAKVIITIG